MIKWFFLLILLFLRVQQVYATPLLDEFKKTGYVKMENPQHGVDTFDALYLCFDAFIAFLHQHPGWAQKLYGAKERFIRSKERNYYSTDFFGFYDESEREGRRQISFYYASHFHEFLDAHYPEFFQVTELVQFFEACQRVQSSSGELVEASADQLGIEGLFSSCGYPPILLKVIKYLPSYRATRPHYDGSAFSLFLDSTDPKSLLLSPYQVSFAIDDFFAPVWERNPDFVLLIPGALLTEFAIFPTPHIVVQSGKTRYATVAFAMRPHYTPAKMEFSLLPSFKD